ncbi:MAG: hypothetical protein KF770_31540 [Anaerolineae bacterium]|nr:hypothetical protein [Anaerolineae bacterium]
MFSFKDRKESNTTSSLSFQAPVAYRHLFWRLVPLLLLLLVITACDADNPTIPPEVCDAYEDTLFTVQVIGGAAIVVGLALLAFKKSLASIIPSQGAQTGAIATTIGLGVFLLTFSTEWGTTLLSVFGLPDMYTLCGLG